MNLEELQQLTGESDNKILSLLLLRAKNIILTETKRTKMISSLESLIPEIVLELYNRQGSEGEQSRSEGGVSVSYAEGLSPHLLSSIRNYRLARVGGHAFEKNETETVQTPQIPND